MTDAGDQTEPDGDDDNGHRPLRLCFEVAAPQQDHRNDDSGQSGEERHEEDAPVMTDTPSKLGSDGPDFRSGGHFACYFLAHSLPEFKML